VLCQEHDPVFPREWSDRLDDFFTDVTLPPVDGVGHFTPVECPKVFADLIRSAHGAPAASHPA
jgi:pimeloyl-ACP methyl ester carboxylesterase